MVTPTFSNSYSATPQGFQQFTVQLNDLYKSSLHFVEIVLVSITKSKFREAYPPGVGRLHITPQTTGGIISILHLEFRNRFLCQVFNKIPRPKREQPKHQNKRINQNKMHCKNWGVKHLGSIIAHQICKRKKEGKQLYENKFQLQNRLKSKPNVHR